MFRNEFLILPQPIETLEQDTLYLLGLAEAHHSLAGRRAIGLNCAPRPRAAYDEHDPQAAN
jgi:hypothetical protein